MAFHLGNRARLALRYAGIAVVALIVFVFALQMTFPYNRVRAKVEESLQEKFDVKIGDVERGWLPGRVYFKAITLRTRQTKPNDPVTTFYIEKLEVDLGIFALLRGIASVDIDAKIGPGHIKGNLAVGKSGTNAHIDGVDLPGGSLPMRALLGLPMTGKIEFSVALDLPNDTPKGGGKPAPNWAHASGKIDLSCPSGCTFGDGKTKLRPLLKNSSNQVMVGEGIDFGQVNIDSLVAKVEITPATSEKGTGKLELKQFDAKSKDGELHIEYAMALEKDFQESQVTGCLRFKGSDALQKREPKTYAAITTTGAEIHASDGLFHIKLTDRFRDMKKLNMECGPNVRAIGNGENFTGVPKPNMGRPNLTIQPEPPPGGSAAPPPQVPPQPVMAAPPPVAAPPAGSAAPAAGSAGLSNGAMPRPPGPEGEGPPPPAGSAGSAEGAAPAQPAGTPAGTPVRRW